MCSVEHTCGGHHLIMLDHTCPNSIAMAVHPSIEGLRKARGIHTVAAGP